MRRTPSRVVQEIRPQGRKYACESAMGVAVALAMLALVVSVAMLVGTAP